MGHMLPHGNGTQRTPAARVQFTTKILWLLIIGSVPSPSKGDLAALFPFGLPNGDTEVTDLRDGFAPVGASEVLPFYGDTTSYVLLAFHRGSVSMDKPCDTSVGSLPFSKPPCESARGVLVPVSKINITNMISSDNGGRMYFRHGTKVTSAQLTIIGEAIETDFNTMFKATYAVFVTWENVRDAIQNKPNTFQIAIATDGNRTYAYFNYHELNNQQDMSVGIQRGGDPTTQSVAFVGYNNWSTAKIVTHCTTATAPPCVRWAWDVTDDPPVLSNNMMDPKQCINCSVAPTRCDLPLDVGNSGCPDAAGGPFVRYHRDGSSCTGFSWLGCGGNENRFRDKLECRMHCATDKFDTLVAPEGIPERCLELKDGGLCTDTNLVENFYYNKFSGECKKLMYTGCGGNNNRFTKKKDCKNTCINFAAATTSAPATTTLTPTTPALTRCDLQLDIGSSDCTTSGSYDRFYWDGSSCSGFTWQGCNGTDNRFTTRYECRMHCSPSFDDPLPQDPNIPSQCLELRDGGLGTQELTRFFYNKFTNKCRRMTYTGSGGNNNIFNEKPECLDTCVTLL